MGNPKAKFSNRRSDPNGVGPYTFDIPELSPGDTHKIDLNELEKGRFVGLSPAGYDSIQVTNSDTSNGVTVQINENLTFGVPQNSIQGLDQSGIYVIEVTNTGSGTIDESDVVVEILKQPYGSDEQARHRLQESPIRKFVRGMTGL